MKITDKNISSFSGGGQSNGVRLALRRTVGFEDLKETTITVVTIGRTTIEHNN